MHAPYALVSEWLALIVDALFLDVIELFVSLNEVQCNFWLNLLGQVKCIKPFSISYVPYLITMNSKLDFIHSIY